MGYFFQGTLFQFIFIIHSNIAFCAHEDWRNMTEHVAFKFSLGGHFTKRNTKRRHQPAMQSEQMWGPVLLWGMQSVLPSRTLSGYLEVEEQETLHAKGQVFYHSSSTEKQMLPWNSQDSGASEDYNLGCG